MARISKYRIHWTRVVLTTLVCATSWLRADAYIPALPTNVTPPLYHGSTTLNLTWLGGNYTDVANYIMAEDTSNGLDQGVLVHFSEENLSNDTTTTPWIALIACDSNATDASLETDIFTEAANRGAVGALLYSLYSEYCFLQQPYIMDNVSHPIDIFTPPSLHSSLIIDTRFDQKDLNVTEYRNFNASALNNIGSSVNGTLKAGWDRPISMPSIIFATLTNGTLAPNGTESSSRDGSSSIGSAISASAGIATRDTSLSYTLLAMIIWAGSVLL